MYVQQLLESANEVAEGYKSIAKKHVEVDYDVNPLISTRRYHGNCMPSVYNLATHN